MNYMLNILNIFIFFINPFICLILNIFKCIFLNVKKINLLLISLSLSVLLVYLPIMYDTISNFMKYIKMDINNLNYYNKIPYILKKLNFEYISVVSIYIFIIIYLWLYLYADINITNDNDKKTLKIGLFLFLFIFTYRELADINRYSLANIIVIISIFKIRKIKVIFFLLAVLIHSAVMITIVAYYLSRIINIKKLKFFLYLSPLILAIDKILINMLLKIISKVSIHYYNIGIFYLENETWGRIAIYNQRLNLIVFRILTLIIIFLILIYLKNVKNNDIKIIYILLSLSIISLNFIAFTERNFIPLLLISVYIFYYEIKCINNKQIKLISIVFILFIRSLFIDFWMYRNVYTNDYSKVIGSFEQRLLFMKKIPILSLKSLIDIKKNGYSNEYIWKNSNRRK